MAKPLKEPREIEYEETENTDWEEVDKNFGDCLKAWYDKQGEDMPDNPPHAFNACSEDCKQWISGLTVLGNPEAKTFDVATKLMVKNPNTGKLNKHAVWNANSRANQVKGISDATVRKTKEYLSALYDKEWGEKSE